MYIKQLYTNCLAQAAYYIESEGEVMIIDPMREPAPYLELAKKRNAQIKYIFETHFHADFVSGHLDIAKLSGAQIVFGPGAKPSYPAYIAQDLETLALGKISCQVLHTPGHTVESSCILLRNENGNAVALFSGDTLFVGDVGRPDLMSGNHSKEELAAMLFDSLQRLKKLPDAVTVYPGHGAGSACGKNIGKELQTTIGEQKKYNYALRENNKDAFISVVTSDLPVPPAYFFKDARINISGYDSFEVQLEQAKKLLSYDQFNAERKAEAIVLDVRSAEQFATEHFAGSLNIGLNGDFASWAGTLIEFGRRIIVVCNSEQQEESITRLLRVGYDNIAGIVLFDSCEWKQQADLNAISNISPAELPQQMQNENYVLLDVRRKTESEMLRVSKTVHIPLAELPAKMVYLDKNLTYLVMCAGGYRSMIACSLLLAAGFKSVKNVSGGANGLRSENSPLIRATIN